MARRGKGAVRRIVNRRGRIQKVRVRHLKQWSKDKTYDRKRSAFVHAPADKAAEVITPFPTSPEAEELVIVHIKTRYEPGDRSPRPHAKSWDRKQTTLWGNRFKAGAKGTSDWSIRYVVKKGEEKEAVASAIQYFAEEWGANYGLALREGVARVEYERATERDKKGDLEFVVNGEKSSYYQRTLRRYLE